MPLKPRSDDNAQVEKFKELACDLGCNEDEAVFEATVKRGLKLAVSQRAHGPFAN